MIIVSGKLYIRAGERGRFLESSLQTMTVARHTQGCRDFVIAPDPIEPDRVNVYEAWDSESELQAFRGSGPGADLTDLIVSSFIGEHEAIAR